MNIIGIKKKINKYVTSVMSTVFFLDHDLFSLTTFAIPEKNSSEAIGIIKPDIPMVFRMVTRIPVGIPAINKLIAQSFIE